MGDNSDNVSDSIGCDVAHLMWVTVVGVIGATTAIMRVTASGVMWPISCGLQWWV